MKQLKRPVLLLLLLVFTMPFVFLFILSIADGWDFPHLLPSGYNANRWSGLMENSSGLFQSLQFSIMIGLAVAIISTITGFMISRSISSHSKKKYLLFACYFPLALSPVIYSLLLNHFFIMFSLSGTFTGVVIAQLIIAIPFSILLLSSFWNEEIRALAQVSTTLGSNLRQTFFMVLLPVALPQLMVCFFQTFLISWFEYGLTTIIGVGKVQTLTLKVYQYIGEANIFYAALSGCIIVLPPAIFLWINKRFVFYKLN
ncbi:MAG: hypothetical protein ABIT58_10880 [Ferruginibacter sp.]